MKKIFKKYRLNNVNDAKIVIDDEDDLNTYRIAENCLIRKRKISARGIILYELNKRGLTTKMEILNFTDITQTQKISSPGLLKQREKLSPQIFIDLMVRSLKLFYHQHKEEVVTYKGYIVLGVDGSDFEIPNTRKAREENNGKQQQQCARVTVSTCYDLLNKYTVDAIVENYDHSETEMAYRHYQTIKEKDILDTYKSIYIMDRGYVSLSNMYRYINNNDKFLIRVPSKYYEKEKESMKTDDEIIEITANIGRLANYKKTDLELYNYLKEGNSINVRCVKIELSTGEIEYLFTNLSKEEFTKEEINELYNLRWNVETNYKHLKNNVKIECITSSKKILIEQDIYGQIYAANLLQCFINDIDGEIDQSKYKNKMKVNSNMAIGIFKNTFINIILEKNKTRRKYKMNKLMEAMQEYIIPIKRGRSYPRTNNPKNRYNINQRKSF